MVNNKKNTIDKKVNNSINMLNLTESRPCETEKENLLKNKTLCVCL